MGRVGFRERRCGEERRGEVHSLTGPSRYNTGGGRGEEGEGERYAAAAALLRLRSFCALPF